MKPVRVVPLVTHVSPDTVTLRLLPDERGNHGETGDR